MVCGVLICLIAGLASTGLVWWTNEITLHPWRKAKDQHWTEQARLVHPVVVAARSNLWVIPAITGLVVAIIRMPSFPLWVFAGIASAAGCFAGTLPLNREIYPRITLRELIRIGVKGYLVTFLYLAGFLVILVVMPNEFNLEAGCLGLLALCLVEFWQRGLMMRLGKKIGWQVPAPERLRRIVTETAARMHVEVREILLIRVPIAQAVALPGRGIVMFTDRLLEIFPDEEIAAIAAHELAHLTEPRGARLARRVGLLAFLPWIFFNPTVHLYSLAGFLGLCLITLAVSSISRRISRRLETRADDLAVHNELNEGTYAQALTRLHEDNLIPAVMAKNRSTHPHLYDRLLAAGITPDFARPEPADEMAGHGHLFAGLLGIAGVFYVIQLVHS